MRERRGVVVLVRKDNVMYEFLPEISYIEKKERYGQLMLPWRPRQQSISPSPRLQPFCTLSGLFLCP